MKGIDVPALREAIAQTRTRFLTTRLGESALLELNERWDISADALSTLTTDELTAYREGSIRTVPPELDDAESDFHAFVQTSFIPVNGYRPASFHEYGVDFSRHGYLVDLRHDIEWTEVIRVIIDEDGAYHYEKYHLNRSAAEDAPIFEDVEVGADDIEVIEKGIVQLRGTLEYVRGISTPPSIR